MTVERESQEYPSGDEHAARKSVLVASLALLAGVAVGVGMGIKLQAGAGHVERRMEDYRGAWHQIRGH